MCREGKTVKRKYKKSPKYYQYAKWYETTIKPQLLKGIGHQYDWMQKENGYTCTLIRCVSSWKSVKSTEWLKQHKTKCYPFKYRGSDNGASSPVHSFLPFSIL